MITPEEREAAIAILRNRDYAHMTKQVELAEAILREFPADDLTPVRDDEPSWEWLKGEGAVWDTVAKVWYFKHSFGMIVPKEWVYLHPDFSGGYALCLNHCNNYIVIRLNPTRRDVRALVALCKGE